MASNSNPTGSTSPIASDKQKLKRNSEDIGWRYGELETEGNKERVKCNFCNFVCAAGISRFKKHIAGIRGSVRPCPKAPEDVKLIIRESLDLKQEKKRKTRENNDELRKEVVVGSMEEEQTKEAPINYGPLDKYVEINPVNPTKLTRQPNPMHLFDKEKIHSVQRYIARWVYVSGISFNSIQNSAFVQMLEAVGQFGPNARPPSRYQLSNPLLREEVENVKEMLKKHQEEWAHTGCSIMTDAWSDRRRRSVMNLCVHCSKGVSFFGSKEASEDSHTGQYIFQFVDQCIETIGSDKVIQIVTDNASNNMAAANLMLEKRPTLFWTGCGTHTLNLILEGIGKIPKYKSLIDMARSLTIFIYSHHKTLSIMRNFVKGEIVRPGVTRFASTFLSLQSLLDKQRDLRLMALSSDWTNCKVVKSVKGKQAHDVLSNNEFWKGVASTLSILTPLVRLLRITDGDKPSMPWLYGEFEQAKKELVEIVFKGIERNYKPIMQVIEDKCKNRNHSDKSNGRLDGDLHITAYLLNPFYLYRNPNLHEIVEKATHIKAWLNCLDKFFPPSIDIDLNSSVNDKEFVMYKTKDKMFGRKGAQNAVMKSSVESFNPVEWWVTYGIDAPNLRKMAIKILSLTTSSSGCERNWSTFEGIHTKKRNRLTSSKLSQLVYIQFNTRLLETQKKKNESSSIEDVLLCPDSRSAQHWLLNNSEDNSDSDFEVRDVNDDEFDSSNSDEETYTRLDDGDFELPNTTSHGEHDFDI